MQDTPSRTLSRDGYALKYDSDSDSNVSDLWPEFEPCSSSNANDDNDASYWDPDDDSNSRNDKLDDDANNRNEIIVEDVTDNDNETVMRPLVGIG